MQEVLIVAKTRMSNNVCVGGLLADGSCVRLLTKFGKNQPVDCDLQVGCIYDIDFQKHPNTTAPHTEDVLCNYLSLKQSYQSNSEIIQHIKSTNVPIGNADINQLFDQKLQWTSSGRGFISDERGGERCGIAFAFGLPIKI